MIITHNNIDISFNKNEPFYYLLYDFGENIDKPFIELSIILNNEEIPSQINFLNPECFYNILNQLRNKGFTIFEANEHSLTSGFNYSPLIDLDFKEEADDNRFTVINYGLNFEAIAIPMNIIPFRKQIKLLQNIDFF